MSVDWVVCDAGNMDPRADQQCLHFIFLDGATEALTIVLQFILRVGADDDDD